MSSYPEDIRADDPLVTAPTERMPRNPGRADERILEQDHGEVRTRDYVADDLVDDLRVEGERHRSAQQDGRGLTGTDRPLDRGSVRVDHGSTQDTPEVVEKLREPDTRARLLLAIAGMTGLALIFSLISVLLLATQGGDDPVLVDGVPCLVQDGPDDQALLYCQR